MSLELAWLLESQSGLLVARVNCKILFSVVPILLFCFQAIFFVGFYFLLKEEVSSLSAP